MTQIEFYKSFQFVLELLIPEIVFVFRLKRRSHFFIRAGIGIALCFIFAWLFPIKSNSSFYVAFMFLTIFIFTALVCKFIFKESWLTIFFCCIAGYTTQHLAYELHGLVQCIMGVSGKTPMGFYGSEFSSIFLNPFLTIVYFYVYIIIYYLSFFFFGRRIKEDEPIKLKSSFIFLFAIFIMIVDVLLNAIVVYHIASAGNTLNMLVVGIYNILCCVIALYLQFEVALRRRLEDTLETLQRIWHQVKEQYAISKENIELINLKCHDLKHQIRLLGNNMVNSSLLKEIENRIDIYDSVQKTGNDALDVILTEKNLLCKKNDIKLNCMVDGKNLSFMKEEDIYALFGNIVDNAIEAVMKVQSDKRFISLNIKAIENLLSISTYNIYNESLQFEDGLPKTTKENKKYHGYGIKSMQYICRKYDGDISIKTEDDVFYINILLPLNG